MDIASWETEGEQISSQGWFEKGEAALGESKHSEAAGFFGNVLKYDPFNAKAHCRLSDVYRAQGKTEDALNSMTQEPWSLNRGTGRRYSRAPVFSRRWAKRISPKR